MSKRILIVSMMTLGLVALSSCHGNSGGTYKMRFVNATDSATVMEFSMQNPSVMARVHMAVFSARIKGTFVQKDADAKAIAEGTVQQDEKGYTLVSRDGERKRYETQDSDTLKDESGTLWTLDNPKTTLVKERASLRQWAVSK
jgi:hypothetical protein